MMTRFACKVTYVIKCLLCGAVAPEQNMDLMPDMQLPHPSFVPGWTMAYGITACPKHKVVVTISTDGSLDSKIEITGWQG